MTTDLPIGTGDWLSRVLAALTAGGRIDVDGLGGAGASGSLLSGNAT
jgi:hypothetical protein